MDPAPSDSPSTANPGFNIRMTNDEMLANVLDWSLGCDTAVLNHLKDYSENMLRRAGTIKEDCNSFAQEVDMLQTRVQSVTNQFLNLANDQFVENCVEEFEERDAIKQASPSPLVHQVRTKAEKEAELIKKMKESIQVGIKSNSLCDQLSSVPKVKTAHIIGTSKFFGSRFCGLLEEDRLRPNLHMNTVMPETPLSQHDPHQPVGLSESISIPKAPSSTDSENLFHSRDTAQSQLSKPDSSLSSEENFLGANRTPFTSSSNSVGTNQSLETDLRKHGDYPTARPPISIIDDLNNVLKARVPPPTTADSDSEEDFKPRSGTGRDLFADDDDEDIFTAHAKASAHSIRSPDINDRSSSIPSKIANIAPVSKNSSVNQINSIADLIKAQRQMPDQTKTQPAKQSVFRDSDSDGEGDLFSSSSSARSSNRLPTKTKSYQNLFADDQDSLSHQKPQPHASVPQTTVIPETPQLQPTPVLPNIRPDVPKLEQKQQRSIFDESDSDDDLFSASSSKRGGGTSTTSTDTEQPSVRAKALTNKFPGSTNLFENVAPAKSNIVIEQAKVVPTSTVSKPIFTPSVDADTESTMSETTTTATEPATEELMEPAEAERHTTSTSRKSISQKLENIFKVTGPPLPGIAPKRNFSKPDVSNEANDSQNTPEEDQENTKTVFPGDDIRNKVDSIAENAVSTPSVHPITDVKQTSRSLTFDKDLFNEFNPGAGGKNQSAVGDTTTSPPPRRQISQSSFASSDEDGLTQAFSSFSVDNLINCEHPVTFDEPPNHNLLISATKNRVKITHKRRRPIQKPVAKAAKDEITHMAPELTSDNAPKLIHQDNATIPTNPDTEESKPVCSHIVPEVISNIVSDSTVSKLKPSVAISNPSSSSPNVLPSLSSEPKSEKDEKIRVEVPHVVEPNSSRSSTYGPSGSAPAARKEMSKERLQVSATISRSTYLISDSKPDMKVSDQHQKPTKQSIFDDSDSDSDIFSPAKTKTITSVPSNKAVNGVFSTATAGYVPVPASQAFDSTEPTPTKVLQKSSKVKQQSVFAEPDSDSGDDIFVSKRKNTRMSRDSTNKTADLFAGHSGVEESNDTFGSSDSRVNSRANPVNAITEKSTTKLQPQKSQSSKSRTHQKSIFDDSDSDSDIFSSKSTKVKFT